MENNMWWYSWIGQFITAILSVDEVNWLYVFIGQHSAVSRLKSMRYWNRYTSMAGWLNHFFWYTCLPDSYVSVKCTSLPISQDLAQTKALCIFISCLYSVLWQHTGALVSTNKIRYSVIEWQRFWLLLQIMHIPDQCIPVITYIIMPLGFQK